MLTLYSSARILNYNFGGVAYPSPLPTSYFFGLLTNTSALDFTTPTPTEPSGAFGYVRKEYINNKIAAVGWQDAQNDGTLKNLAEIQFPISTGDWTTIYKIGLFDQLTGGNLWWWDDLTSNRTVPASTQVIFAINSITVRFNNT